MNHSLAISSAGSFFKDFAAHITKCNDSSSNWRTVNVWKKKSDGQYIQDKKGQNIVYGYTMDKRTGELYKGGPLRDDSSFAIKTKCFFLLGINPIYTSVYMTWHLVKAAVHTVRMSMDTVKKISQTRHEHKLEESVGTFFKGFLWDLPQVVGFDLFNVVRAPLYGLGVELACAYGMVNSNEGRKWEAWVERKWHRNISWRHDWRMMRTPESEGIIKAPLKDIKLAKVCYEAFCFQVKDNIKNPRFHIVGGS
jgi:hypothetical protein